MSMFTSALGATAIFAAAAAANGSVVLANWTFEVSLPTTAGPHTAEAGVFAATSQASAFHAGASTYGAVVGNGSARSFSSNNWQVGDYYQFTTSSTGYDSITFQWDHTSSGTGPRDFQLFVSNDGSNFTQIGATFAVLVNGAPNPAWSSGTYQAVFTFPAQSAPALADNQASLTFRLVNSSTVSANGGTVASGGTSRVDNIVISGNLIPAPSSVALLGLAGLLAGRRRRA
jgi:hypothetical protein